jgi:small subunit ribosomal protein S11
MMNDTDMQKDVIATEGGDDASAAKKAKKASPKARRQKKTKRQIASGNAYIQATYNNTIVTLTDQDGNVLSWASAGGQGFRGPKKATPYAASVIVRSAVEKAAEYGLKDVHVFVKGVGQGRESAIRAFNANGLNVVAIKDVTPIPHNGCRPPRARRV